MASVGTAFVPGSAPDLQENLNVHLICRYCMIDPPNLIEDFAGGTILCGDCATVLMENVIDSRSEWRNFANDDQGNDDPSRVGEARNMLLNGSQLSTEIAFNGGDARARELSRAQNKSSNDKENKQLMEAYNQITAYCDRMSLASATQSMAKQLFKNAMEHKAFRAKSPDVIIAACIYISARSNGKQRSFSQIVEATKIPKKEIGRAFKVLNEYFKKKYDQIGGHNASAKELCGPSAAALNLPNSVAIMAGELSERLVHEGPLAGRSPLSVSAVALYVISNFMGYPKTAKECANVCKVSDGTIRHAWKAAYEFRDKLLKPEWLEKGGKMENLPPV